MHGLTKYFSKKFNNFDISPFNPSKIASLIIIIWGLNAVIFLGEIIISEKYDCYNGQYTSCTKIKKIQNVFIYKENFIIPKYCTISFFSVLNSPIPEYDVIKTTLTRGPPASS